MCPLCETRGARELERIPYHRIWRALEAEWQVTFSEDVIARHTPDAHTALRECVACGLQYFSPACTADADFYRELTTGSACRYSTEKWDFDVALGYVSASDRVLDIACGTGEFLGILGSRGCEAAGIDMNAAAIDAARAQGLAAQCISLGEYAKTHAGRFDVAVALQVIEHVAEVQPFMRAALECLKPGGRLIVAVPNRLRRLPGTLEPLDCPPHHVSRWSGAQMRRLADLLGCRVRALRYEPGTIIECRRWLRADVFRGGTERDPFLIKAMARMVFAPPLYFAYERLGLLERWRFLRLSLLCVLER